MMWKKRYNLSLVNTENLATTEFDPQLAVVFDIRCRSTKGNEKSPNVSQDRVNWTSTMADRILPVGNGGVLGSSKSMSKMRVNPYRDRAKSFYQRYDITDIKNHQHHFGGNLLKLLFKLICTNRCPTQKCEICILREKI